jgi:hypothetical protein
MTNMATERNFEVMSEKFTRSADLLNKHCA